PVLMMFLKKELHLQFVDNAYNDFRIVIIASFFTALFYAFYGLFFTYNGLLNLELFSKKIIAYKNASFIYFDFLSEFLYFVSNLKFFIFSYFGNLAFKVLNFIFDFFNFFMFCSLLAFVFNFVLKIKIKIIVLLLCFIMVLGNYFSKEQRNNVLKSEQEQILLWMNNFDFLKDNNLSLIQKEKDLFEKDLKELREIFKKNAFEIGIWWFSKEKEDLEKRINESLK
ncbi:TPA: hypothetical protein RTH01_001106, partial [Campylobacter jejuni]|nr:hypothetical protein [Campylobacter jejuni]